MAGRPLPYLDPQIPSMNVPRSNTRTSFSCMRSASPLMPLTSMIPLVVTEGADYKEARKIGDKYAKFRAYVVEGFAQ